jgi:hypothetical protein
MWHLLVFHCNSSYTNTPQCYVIRTFACIVVAQLDTFRIPIVPRPLKPYFIVHINFLWLFSWKNLHCVVSTVTGLRADDRRIVVRVRVERGFSFLQSVSSVLRPTQRHYQLILGIKGPEREADRSASYSAEVKNEWICVFTPLYAYVSCTGQLHPYLHCCTFSIPLVPNLFQIWWPLLNVDNIHRPPNVNICCFGRIEWELRTTYWQNTY